MVKKENSKEGWLARQKKKVQDKVDDALDKAWSKTMSHPIHQNRWVAACNVHHPSQIDYSVPVVELEAQLCDIRKLALIRKGKRRDEFLALLSPEAQDIYLHKTDAHGNRYTDLEEPSVLKSVIKGMKKKWKKDYGAEITPEIEQAMDEMIADDDENV